MQDRIDEQAPPPVPIEHSVHLRLGDDEIDILLSLSRSIFPNFQDDYLLGRLALLQEPVLHLAERGGELAGFKFGYRRDQTTLYSWLGGVQPAARRSGVAQALMARQHAWAAEAGYRFIDTRARAANNAMIMLNLRHGFHVVGFEIDERGLPMVLQRKSLAASAAGPSRITP